MLESLKIEIVKTFFIYNINNETEIKDLIPSGFEPGIQIKEDSDDKKEKPFEINISEEMKNKEILNKNIFNDSIHLTHDSNNSNRKGIKIINNSNRKKIKNNLFITDDKSSERKFKTKSGKGKKRERKERRRRTKKNRKGKGKTRRRACKKLSRCNFFYKRK